MLILRSTSTYLPSGAQSLGGGQTCDRRLIDCWMCLMYK